MVTFEKTVFDFVKDLCQAIVGTVVINDPQTGINPTLTSLANIATIRRFAQEQVNEDTAFKRNAALLPLETIAVALVAMCRRIVVRIELQSKAFSCFSRDQIQPLVVIFWKVDLCSISHGYVESDRQNPTRYHR